MAETSAANSTPTREFTITRVFEAPRRLVFRAWTDHWTGTELVLSTFGGAKVAALRARPAVAITIDAASTPPEVLLIRGPAEVTEVDGIVPEYILAHYRYAGSEQGAANIAAVDHPGTRMFRIAVRPTWVGVLDFQTRLPGGASPEEFDQRGRS
ncbi:pyridoxamine 5'-phosphate oxidase [Dactylosporangium sp. NBC_01737]|uniref:SRPBCC family protein n=1 Tax=Dactylosporangium sp. NBC_01737 TaxID=2975959 RepID=UPI002E104DC3|nr:pyridoxamine 5'-phosphate oxidase [Dactylosporangium sp. NBC_01737]